MKTFTERMEEKIKASLAALNRSVEALRSEPRSQELQGGGDNTPLSDEAEVMEAGADEAVRSDLLERLLARAAELQQALGRIREGTYGICSSCGEPIARSRLEAIPEASLCLHCQQRAEETSPETGRVDWRRTRTG